MEKIADKLLIFFFIVFLFGFGILLLVLPDKGFSPNENRYLQMMPKFTAGNIVNGSFMADFETYLSDQFPFRDFWVTSNTVTKELLQKKDIGGVYVGSDGYLLEVFDMQLEAHGRVIHAKRAETIEKLGPIVARHYRAISGDREKVELSYRSELNGATFGEVLAAARDRDIANQFTTSGVHRDDMVMRIGGYPLKKYGSQGQQKSFLIALKLAQHAIIAEETGERPILLLDDLFDKLDASRLEALITLVGDGSFGQTVISDCNHTRLTSILDNCGARYTLFTVEEGEITEERREA